jgi:hypothetical protein
MKFPKEYLKSCGKLCLVILFALIVGGILQFSGIARGPVTIVVQLVVMEIYCLVEFFRLPRTVDAAEFRNTQIVFGILLVLLALLTIPYIMLLNFQ